jgi:hypothetical protein
MPRRMRRVAAICSKASAGIALPALIAAACTSGGSVTPGVRATAPVGPDLVLSARAGGPDAAILGRGTVPSLLARTVMSCPGATQAPEQQALLDATWSYHGGETYLARLTGGFDLKTGVALPFITVTLDPPDSGTRGRLRLWTSALLQGNHVNGYHTTGWIAAGTPAHPFAVRLKDPHLAVQVWAANPLTGLFYCVSDTGFNLGARQTSAATVSQTSTPSS